MRAVKVLPQNYFHLNTLDLSTPNIAVRLNLAAIPLLFMFGWFFTYLINLKRIYTPLASGFFGFFTSFSGWGLIAFLLSIIFMLVLHELIHGIFFYLFTHSMPKFALKSGYAYAASPDWFLPSSQYIIVGSSPLVLISIISIITGWFVIPSLIPYLLIIATFNAAGSLGDMIVVGWVVRQPRTIYIRDVGDIFYSYEPSKDR